MPNTEPEKIVKKVRRRRAGGRGVAQFFIALLLLPILLLPGGSPNVVDSDYVIPVEHWTATSYASQVPPPEDDPEPDLGESAKRVVEVTAPASAQPLNVPPVEADLEPEGPGGFAPALPLDPALWPRVPAHRMVIIGSRRSTGRGIAYCSTAVTATTTTTAAAPVPEPGATTLLLTALAGTVAARRRRPRRDRVTARR